ncbi:MAG: multicopper oxidase domain-containing protein [Acidimicrobiales bacterium]
MTIIESPASGASPTPDQRPNPAGESLSPGWIMGVILGALGIGVVGFVAIVLGAVALGGSDTAEEVPSTTLDVTLREFSIDGNLTAPAGEVTLRLTNSGSMAHNVEIPALGALSPDLGPGGSFDLVLGELAPGTYEVICNVAGHEASGMVATLTVTGDGVAAAASDGHGAHGGEMDYAAMDAAMMESMLAFPAETEGKGNPVLAPTEVLADGTKVFDLTAEIVDWEVEPGKFVEAWTYNGVVPAPQILLDRGDKVQVRVVNDLPMGTDIHWHGVHTPNDQDGVAPYTQDLIEPNGGTFTYEFTAVDDAIGMYHAHNHAQMQVVNGMFGAIRIGDNPIPYGQTINGVEIPDEIDLAVDMPMILNDAGTIGLTLNGKSFPATEPLVLQQGDWASITYYNEGLQIHPMHLHQFPQLVYAKDGIPLEQPYWVDTLNIAPGERYTVIFRADDPGVWVWHCHILNHVEREDGMFGMVTAIIVEENEAFDPEENPVTPTNWRMTATSGGPVETDDEALHTVVDHGDDTADDTADDTDS